MRLPWGRSKPSQFDLTEQPALPDESPSKAPMVHGAAPPQEVPSVPIAEPSQLPVGEPMLVSLSTPLPAIAAEGPEPTATMRGMPAPIPSLPLWRRLPPFAWALIAGVLSLLAAFVPTAWHMLATPPGPPAAQAKEPWRIDVGADGTSRVMGLQLGTDTLGSLQGRLGEALQPAIVARRGEAGALEAQVDPFSAGFVAGRLVLAFDAPADALARWREGAAKSDVLDTGARRYTLAADSAHEAASARLAGATFVPALSLSVDDVTQRFGAPAAVQAGGEGLQTWLYPDRGLAIALQPGRKAVLQYVAPTDFERRLLPVMAPAASDRTPARTTPPTTR